jgi:hypothetical protein
VISSPTSGSVLPVLKFVFWSMVAIDAAAIVLFFLLGLTEAGTAGAHPLQVTLFLLVLPSIPLIGAVILYTRFSHPILRIAAFALAAAPLIIALSVGALAENRFRASTSAHLSR